MPRHAGAPGQPGSAWPPREPEQQAGPYRPGESFQAAGPDQPGQPGAPWPTGPAGPPRPQARPAFPGAAGAPRNHQAPHQPGPSGPAGPPPSHEPADDYPVFDGGYAPVIRPSDYAEPPAGADQDAYRGRAASPPPADDDVYIYRDDSEPEPAPAAPPRSADDPGYWYDVLSGEPAPEHREIRGPFEPLVSSSGQNRAARPSPDGAAPPEAGTEQQPPQGAPAAAPAERERKLDQLKDLYLTAGAIGEPNLDQHFDELMAQQRQLISDYFGQPGAPGPAAAGSLETEAEAEPWPTSGEVTPPEGVPVWAEPPRP
jgi:hypothetical protein